MKSADELPGVASLRQDLATFRYSLFRLETLQRYFGSSEDPAYAEYRRSGDIPVTDALRSWCDRIRLRTSQGAVAQRVHVVAEPPTEYLEFELASYLPNVAAGEDVRIVPVHGEEWPADVSRDDFWLVDSHKLWTMRYSPDGEWLGSEPVDDPELIVRACTVRDAALAQAVPLKKYLNAT